MGMVAALPNSRRCYSPSSVCVLGMDYLGGVEEIKWDSVIGPSENITFLPLHFSFGHHPCPE